MCVKTKEPAPATLAPAPLVSIEATAHRLGISKAGLRKMLDAGKIASIQIGKRRMLDTDDVEAFILANKAAGKPEAWKLFRRDTGHFETAEMRAEILAWLDRWL
jgi:excisionase family DNA binding protein